jgi:hypothetical protein
MCLAYFGVGGKKSDPAKRIKEHLNWRTASVRKGPGFNHYVRKEKLVKATIFHLNCHHKAQKAEQSGINFVTTTRKQPKQRPKRIS